MDKIYFNVKPTKVQYDHLRIKNISVVGCTSYSDCTYIERIVLQCEDCSEQGEVRGDKMDKYIYVKFKIETGYLPYSVVRKTLRDNISKLRIYKIDEFLDAFKYRNYYCKI